MWQTDGEVRLDLDWSSCSSGPAGEWSPGKVKCVGPSADEHRTHRRPDPSFGCSAVGAHSAIVPLGPLDPRGGSQVPTPDDVTPGRGGWPGYLETKRPKSLYRKMLAHTAAGSSLSWNHFLSRCLPLPSGAVTKRQASVSAVIDCGQAVKEQDGVASAVVSLVDDASAVRELRWHLVAYGECP